MRIVTPDQFGCINIGRVGEHETAKVEISVKGWAETYGAGTFTLLHRRAQDVDAYPCVTTVTGDTLSWVVTSSDAQYSGYGQAELVYTVGTAIAKSVIYLTKCEEALGSSGTVPAPWQSWVDTVIAAKTAAEDAAEDAEDAAEAIENMSAQASVDANIGTPSVTVTKSTISGHEDLAFAFKNLKGQKGDTGEKGDKGDTGASAYTFTNDGSGHITIAESEA